MQRNHQGSALLRACRQVPDWWTVGGRRNPYAIEFVGLGTTVQFYSKAGTYTGDDAMTMWIRPTATIANGVDYGLFSVYDAGLGQDIFTVELQGDTTNGNTLELFLQGVSQGKVLKHRNHMEQHNNHLDCWEGPRCITTECWRSLEPPLMLV